MIVRWTGKKLLRSRGGVLSSASAIGVAFLLVMFFEAAWKGESEQLVAYFRHTDADVWVMQRGVVNMHMATSFIPDSKRDMVRRVEGVAEASSILYINTLIEAGGKKWFSYLVGLDQDRQLGGPWAVAQGRTRISVGEAIVPEVLASLSDVGLGDRIRIANSTFDIVGLSVGTFSAGNPVTFVRASDLADTISLVGYDSYLLVKGDPGVPPELLAARIRDNVGDVEALPVAALIANDLQLARQMGVELIVLMTAISMVLAGLLVAFVLFAHVSRSRRDLAIVKALGFRNRHVYAAVVFEAVVLTGIAFALSILWVSTIIALAPSALPQITMHLTGATVAKVGGAGLAVAVLASLVPARQIMRIDPLLAFQG